MIKYYILQEYIKNLQEYIKKYKELHKDSIDKFVENQYEISQVALDIFIKIAKIANLDLQTVVLERFKKVAESTKKIFLEATTHISIPEFGNVNISNTKGTVVFVDITNSTQYFKEEKNYTSFVIFNAYILLVKTITRLTGGEFLEHTGDGAMIFFKDKDIIEDYKKSFNNGIRYFYKSKNPLYLYFIVSEYLKNYAKDKNLLEFHKKNVNLFKFKEPALVHIGADYGDILEVNLGDMKKLISKTVWNAANRCKSTGREVVYSKNYSGEKSYYKIPLKIED